MLMESVMLTVIASLLLGVAALITSIPTLISALRGRELVIAERLQQRREPGDDNQLALPF